MHSFSSRRLVVLTAFLAPLAAPAMLRATGEPAGGKFDAMEGGRACAKEFYDGKTPELWAKFSPEMKAALGSEKGLGDFREKVAAQAGAEISIVSEDVAAFGKLVTYTRVARFAKFAGPVNVSFSFDEAGAIHGFYIKPAPTEASSTRLDYTTKTELRLPFGEAWFVFWGGRTMAQNYHAVSPQQRFAYDVLIMKDGSSHVGDGKKNEDYHCFGKPVFAPAAGKVVAIANDVKDNVPGETNPARLLGNHVILDHGNGEFSFLVHFKQGSVEVSAGQNLKAGDLLGSCGNSGNSTEPHLHYHLQTTADIRTGEGLPASFVHYVADGKPVERGEPVKGQTIEPGPADQR